MSGAFDVGYADAFDGQTPPTPGQVPLQVDVTAMSQAILRDSLVGVRVVTELPANLVDVLPCIRVVRVGGGDDGIVLDQAMMAYHCYWDSDVAARNLAYSINSALRNALGAVVNNAALTKYRKVSGPAWAGYENTLIRQYVVMHYQWVKAAPGVTQTTSKETRRV